MPIKVYCVWMINRKTGSVHLLEIYQDSERALMRKRGELEKLKKQPGEVLKWNFLVEERYAML